MGMKRTFLNKVSFQILPYLNHKQKFLLLVETYSQNNHGPIIIIMVKYLQLPHSLRTINGI